MYKQATYALVILGAIIFPFSHLLGSHLRAGEITVQRVNCSGNDFLITITVYTNTTSSVRFGAEADVEFDDILDFGDGSQYLVPAVSSTLRPDLGTNIGIASYSIVHTYRGSGTYLISYREPNRNEGVLIVIHIRPHIVKQVCLIFWATN